MAGDPLLYPVGHLSGRFFPGVDAPLRGYRVRIGAGMERLRDDAQFRVWALAHGLPDRSPEGPWTRRHVEAEAGEADLPDAATDVDDLLARGLLVEVDPTSDAAVRFAEAYRIEPLLAGLGNSPDDLGSYAIGLVGREPVVRVSRVPAELWQWAHVCASLWEACQLMAAVARDTGETDSAFTEARGLLDRVFPALRRLLAHNAAHLDIVRGAR